MNTDPKAVIFDLDGTLYDHRKLRHHMYMDMVKHILGHPAGVADLKIVYDFRVAREKNSHLPVNNIEMMQFKWGAGKSKVSVEKVRRLVNDWMLTRPLPHLSGCCYPGVREFFALLKEKDIRTGVFSDYPAREKLKALKLKPDTIVCATDADVDRFKPDPKGLFVAAAKLGMPVEQCLYIGDRDGKDGECARRAGMPYLIMNRARSYNPSGFKSYFEIAESFKLCRHHE